MLSWLLKKFKKKDETNDLNITHPKDIEYVDDDYKPQTASVLKSGDSSPKGRQILNDLGKELNKFNFKFFHLLKPEMKLVNIDRKQNGNIYEVYYAPDYQTGVKFLKKIPRQDIPSLYYVIVETPEGNIGKDIDGIFDEKTGDPIE